MNITRSVVIIPSCTCDPNGKVYTNDEGFDVLVRYCGDKKCKTKSDSDSKKDSPPAKDKKNSKGNDKTVSFNFFRQSGLWRNS